MNRNLDLLDKLHNLRDVIGLLNMAAQAMELKHERNALEHGTMIAQDMLAEITAIVDDDEAAPTDEGDGKC